MNAPREVLEILRKWIRKAEHDLEAARRILAIDENCPYDTVCFHCQQAVEKYLKGVLTLHDIQAPRTHDVELLVDTLPADVVLSVPTSTLLSMNPYAVDVRYADDWREPQRGDAHEALRIAIQIREDVRKQVPPEALCDFGNA